MRRVAKVADHSSKASNGRSMEYRPLGRTGTDDGDVSLDHHRQSGL
jgi:hypothetical protein